MLQDLTYGKLKNAFHVLPPADGDTAFCMRGGSVLLKRLQDDTLELPKVSDVIRWAEEHRWSRRKRCTVKRSTWRFRKEKDIRSADGRHIPTVPLYGTKTRK